MKQVLHIISKLPTATNSVVYAFDANKIGLMRIKSVVDESQIYSFNCDASCTQKQKFNIL